MQIRTWWFVRCLRNTGRAMAVPAIPSLWPLLLSLIFVAPSFGQTLTQLTITPTDTVAGNGTIYTVSFITSPAGAGLPDNGRIRLTFPAGFGVSAVLLAGPVSPPNGITGGFLAPAVAGQLVTLTRDGTGAAVAAADTAVFKMAVVTNPAAAGNYSLTVQTQTNAGAAIDSAPSSLFRIGVGPLAFVKVLNGSSGNTTEVTANTYTADQNNISMHAGGFDANGNYRSDVSVNWSVSGGIGTLSAASGIAITFSANKVGNGQITADHPTAGVIDGATGNIEVVPGALNKVLVVPGPSGNGEALGAYTMTTDQTLPVHAAAYDSDNNYIQDEPVAWSVTNGIGTFTAAAGTATTFNARTPGTGIITANHATLIDGTTGVITVNIGADYRIKILSGASGQTIEVLASSLNSGQTLSVHASIFDQDDNWKNDVTVNWTVTGGIGAVAPASGVSTTFTAQKTGTGVINADHATLLDDATGDITVGAGALAKVKIVQGSSGDGTEMGAVTFNTDNSPVVHAAGYDANDNYLGDQIVSWTVSGGIGTVFPSAGTSTTLTLTTPGSGTVTATHATATGDVAGPITVTEGSPYRVKVLTGANGNTPELTAQTLTTASAPLTVHAGSFDADGNYTNDVPVTWSISGNIGTLNPPSGSVVSVTLTPTTPGNGVFTADHATLLDGVSAPITVSAGALSYVKVVEGPAGNGVELGAKTISTDQNLPIHAAGYDATGNYLGDFSVTWSLSNTNAGTISAATGASIIFNPRRSNTITTINADHATATDDASGNITVGVGIGHHVKVLPNASGSGTEVGNQTLTVGDPPFVVHASSFDADDNRIGDVSVNWILSGGIGSLAPTSGTSTTFTATTVGSGTITADHATFFDDATGTITVTAGTLAAVKIVEGASGPGPEMGGKSLTTDNTLSVHAAGYDANGNYISDVSVDWSVSGNIGTVSPATGTSTTLTLTTPGSGIITADHASATDDMSGTINVSPGAAHHIKILAGASGPAAEVTTATLQVGDPLVVHAGSFDADDNYIADVSVTWNVTGALGALSSMVNTTTTLTAQKAGTGTITADHPTLIDDATGVITVNAGSLAKVRIVEGDAGPGDEVLDKTVTTDETIALHAAGYDIADNYLGDFPVTWSVTNSIGTFSVTTGVSTKLNLTNVGNGVITADHAIAADDQSGTITVMVGNAHHIKVLSGATGDNTPVGAQNVPTGASLLVHAGSFDADENYTGDVSVSWNVTGGIGTVAPSAGTSTTFTATTAGTGTIIAAHGTLGEDATGIITVTTGALSLIRIMDGAAGNTTEVNTRSLTTDQTLLVHAAGFDASGNYLGDFSVTWSVSNGIGVMNPTLGSSSTFDARVPGTGVISADHSTATDDVTGNITVTIGAPNRIKVLSGTSGGTSEVTTATLTAGQTFDVHAGGFDADGNFTGDEPASWTVSGGIGTLAPASGITTRLTATTAGTGVISADHATLIDDATGTITVDAGLLSYIRIYEGSSGKTLEVNTASLTTDQTLTVHAAGFDASGNYLGDYPVNWSVSNNIGALSSATGISTTLEANKPGVGIINADHATATDDATGNITVTVGSAYRLKILSGATGFAAEVTTDTLLTGETLVIHAGSFDRDDNHIGNVSVDWSISGNIGSLNPISGISTIFTANTAGTGVITATTPTLIADLTGTITVQAGSVSYIKIVEGPSGPGSELGDRSTNTDDIITVHAAGYDAGGNYLSDFPVNWSVSGNIGVLSTATGASTQLNLRTPGNGKIFANHATAADDSSGTITVGVGALHSVKVYTGPNGKTGEVANVSLNAGQTYIVHAAGFDADANYRGDEPVDWSLTGFNIGTLAPATGISTTLTARKAGVGQIRADHATAQDGLSGSITVMAGTLAFIKVIEGPAGPGIEIGARTISADDVLQLHAAGFDADTNYVGDQIVNWTSAGNLTPTVSVTGAQSISFAPTLSPASGTIRATHASAGFDETGMITVNDGAPRKIKILSGLSGETAEVGTATVPSGGTFQVHAARFDGDDNYIDDRSVSWILTNPIGTLNPASGVATTFTAGAQGTTTIRAVDGAFEDNTGIISVTTSSVARIILRTAAGSGGIAGGVPFGNATITADDQLTVFAAGYDAGNNYLGEVSVGWTSTGNLAPPVSANGPSFTFAPALAAADNSVNGLIIGAFSPTIKDSTGTITVLPGAPSGPVILTPNPNALAADGNATSTINSGDIKDSDGNNVGSGKLFTITINPALGTIDTPDADPLPGHQIATNPLSRLSFIFKAGNTGGIATITATGGGGAANGSTSISLGSLSIESISTAPATVSQGQTGITVSMQVRNLSSATVTNFTGQLDFIGSANRNVDYVVQAPAPVTLAGSAVTTLSFIVAVNNNATTEAVTINGSAQGSIGATGVSANGTAQTDSWTVQRPAKLTILLTTSADDTVSQGQLNRSVTVRIANDPNAATANVDSVRLVFKQGPAIITSDYLIAPPAGPASIAANATGDYTFSLNVGAAATLGLVTIEARAYGKDSNSNQQISDLEATTPHSWTVVAGNAFRIVSLTPSQSKVTAGMANATRTWTAQMALQNAGTSPIRVNFDPAKTFIRLTIGSQNVTPEYTITSPTALDGGGTTINGGVTGTLTFVITRTGNTRGIATISGFAEATDIPTNQTVQDNTNDGGAGQVEVQSPPIFRLEPLQLSQATVTQNMTKSWRIKAVVRNDGEADLRLHPSPDSIKISIGNNAGYTFNKTAAFATGDSILTRGETDSLFVFVTQTGSALGNQNVTLTLKGRDRNSLQLLNSNSANATVNVQTPSALSILSVRASQPAVSVGQTNAWNVIVVARNNGGSVTILKTDSTNLRFRIGAVFQNDYTVALEQPRWLGSGTAALPALGTDSLRFVISTTGGVSGTAFLWAKVGVTEINSDVVRVATNNVSSVLVQQLPNVSYIANSMLPDIVNNNTSYAFTVRVRNGANRATVVLDPATTKFLFNNGGTLFEANLDANNPVKSIAPGDTTLTFAATAIPAAMPAGTYTPQIQLRGTQNGNVYSANLSVTANELTVALPARVQILSVRPSQNTVTANMVKPWNTIVTVRNNGGSSVRLDSVKLQLVNGNDVTPDFGFSVPSVFLGNNQAALNAGATDSLRFDFDRTGALPGGTALQVSLFVTDLSNGQTIVPPPAGSGSVVVQSRADIKILNLVASQSTVTRNQSQPWTVDVNLRNSGGSDAQLDFTNTRLILSLGGTINPPNALLNGSLILTGNTDATARFTIMPTGSLIGRNDITGEVRGTELNSGDIRTDDTADGGATFVTVQDSAKLHVKSVVLKGAPNLPNVNIGQSFSADVIIENIGEEAADTVRVNFSTAEGSTITPPVNRMINSIPGGQTRPLSFDITAASAEDLNGEIFRAAITGGKARNTGASIVPRPAPDDTGRVFIQRPAAFQITRVIPSETRVEAGRSTPWFIDAVVTNNGGAPIVLNKPSAVDITVQIGGATQIDYTIQADTLLRRNRTRQLAAGEIDTVRYAVLITGSQRGGQATLIVNIAGRDKNNNAPLSDSETGQIEVITTAAVQLVSTSPLVIRKVGELGFVNVEQNFSVEVQVQNISPFERVENVRVRLFSDLGRSTIETTEQVIDSIKTRDTGKLTFSVSADTTDPAALQNETFTARIISAETRGGLPAVIRQGVGDSTAQVLVQRPANLAVAATISEPSLILSSNQVFDFKAYVTNSGQSTVDDNGEVTLNLPPDFTFEPGNPAVRTFRVRVPADTVFWKVRAPSTAATSVDLQVEITQPAKDLNIDAAAQVSNSSQTVRVAVVPTDLKIDRVYVSAPTGATDRTVSTDQTFTVNADLIYSLDLSRTDVELRVPSPYRQVSPNPLFSEFVSWRVQAPNDANEIPTFLVVRAIGYDRSGELVERLDSLSVITVEKADLTLDARITNPPGAVNGNLAFGQTFTVTAALQKIGRANVTDTAKVTLELRNGFTTTEALEKIIDPNGQVQWQVTAPNARLIDSLTIRLTRRPFDENTNAVLEIPPSRRFRRFPVSTDDPGFVQVVSWTIISPLGATDSVVSTGQLFNVRAQIDGRRARTVTAELKLPLGFPPVADALRRFDLINDKQNIDWVIQSPSAPSNGRRDSVRIELTGFDNRSGQPIIGQRGSILVETVDRAQLELRASITEPRTASQGGNVGLNTLVTITARVENLGQAGIHGGARIRLRLPDDPTLPPAEDYRMAEDSIKTADANGVVSWQFRARSSPSTRSETINLRLLIPYPSDINTDAAAAVLLNETTIPIQTERKRLTVQTLPAAQGPVARGETGSLLLRLKLTNESNINSSNILLRALKLHALDRNNKALNASQVIKELRVVDTNNPGRVLARLTPIPAADSMQAAFVPADTLRGTSPQVVDVVVDIADNSSEAFRLVFKRPADIDAIDQDSGDGVEIIFKDERGNDITASQVVSSKRVIAEADFQKAFYNYPNPFDPDAISDTHPQGGTYFNYMLAQAGEIEFRIYTLLGELVYAKSYTSADPEGRPSTSPKRIFWDGRNGAGARVLNGVYLAMLKVGGNTATTKVAVLKK